jgi:hypothetical protein
MKRGFSRLLVTGLIAVLALFASFGSAFAASGDGDPYKTNGDLMQARKWQTEYQAALHERLANADVYDAAVSAVIADLRAQGADTAQLDGELAHFRYHISSIRAEWTEAEAMLKAHPGYDANGQVVDQNAARKTSYAVRDCQRAMKVMGEGIYRRMHHTFVDYGKMNPGPTFVEPTRPTNNSLI